MSRLTIVAFVVLTGCQQSSVGSTGSDLDAGAGGPDDRGEASRYDDAGCASGCEEAGLWPRLIVGLRPSNETTWPTHAYFSDDAGRDWELQRDPNGTGVCWDSATDRIACHFAFDGWPTLGSGMLYLEYAGADGVVDRATREVRFRSFNRCGHEVAYVEVNEYSKGERDISPVTYVDVCGSQRSFGRTGQMRTKLLKSQGDATATCQESQKNRARQ